MSRLNEHTHNYQHQHDRQVDHHHSNKFGTQIYPIFDWGGINDEVNIRYTFFPDYFARIKHNNNEEKHIKTIQHGYHVGSYRVGAGTIHFVEIKRINDDLNRTYKSNGNKWYFFDDHSEVKLCLGPELRKIGRNARILQYCRYFYQFGFYFFYYFGSLIFSFEKSISYNIKLNE